MDGKLAGHELGAAIQGISRFGPGRIQGPLFAVGDDAQAIGGNAEGHQIVLGGQGTPLAQGQVVFIGTTLVGVPFDLHLGGGVGFNPSGVIGQNRLGFGGQVKTIEAEVDALQGCDLSGGRGSSLIGSKPLNPFFMFATPFLMCVTNG